jgi:hypothetical protein
MRLLPLLLLVALAACSPAEAPTSDPGPGPTAAAEPSTGQPDQPAGADRPRRAPLPDGLVRLGRAFIDYALGGPDTGLPTAQTVAIGLDGRPLVHVDEMPWALSDRDLWKVCPAGVEAYAAFSCPLDLLGPIRSARRNRAPLALTRNADVLCARPDIPRPRGRFVVVRPRGPMVSCAFDFALVLHADRQGRLTEALMTVSEP